MATNTTQANMAGDLRREVSSAADAMSDVASRVKDEAVGFANRASERASEFGQQASDRAKQTAQYFREHDMSAIVSDANSYVKAHPTQALLGAAALGFFAAVLLRRR